MMSVSVIIPSFNPNDKLVEVVKALTDSGFNDIIVVNDGSIPLRFMGLF